MPAWTSLLDILILLTGAMLLGSLFERFHLSALLGYLLAGTLLGPNALNLLATSTTVSAMAELGVTLLLFTIGLEFSWRRLRAVGPIALGGGSLQVVVTGVVFAGLAAAARVPFATAVVIGVMASLSSTAAVVRLLARRAELDAIHGRNALGILLLQDIAVVPIMLGITAMGAGGTPGEIMLRLEREMLVGALLVVGMWLVLNHVLPRLLGGHAAAANRDLPILLAIISAVGAAWISHALGFSPVLGSFVAGMLLAESPYATQIRADVVPLRTLFVTLFFGAIGMLTNPAWVAAHAPLLLAAVAAVVVGKTALAAGAVRLFRVPPGQALATGLVLAQVGEFSLVVAALAQERGLIDADLFDLVVATLVTTLFLTPFLVTLAPRLAAAVGSRMPATVRDGDATGHPSRVPVEGHLVIIGFGPAGQRIAEAMLDEPGLPIVVSDLNPRAADGADGYGLPVVLGDASQEEVLESLHVHGAAAVVVTVPDPGAARRIVELLRAVAPETLVIARSRYHIHRWQLDLAGAHAVVDEEAEVGLRLAAAVRQRLRGGAAADDPQR
jgi:CPA2 family monovalent cation:H+ antiporter-2